MTCLSMGNPMQFLFLDGVFIGKKQMYKNRATGGHCHLRIDMRNDCKSARGKPNLKILIIPPIECLYKHWNGITDFYGSVNRGAFVRTNPTLVWYKYYQSITFCATSNEYKLHKLLMKNNCGSRIYLLFLINN